MSKSESLICVLTNKRTREVRYIPANEVYIDDNKTLGQFLEEVNKLKEDYKNLTNSFNKLVDFLKNDHKEVLK